MKISSVVLQTGRKPRWPSSSFDSAISRHFLSRHLAYTFPCKISNDIHLQLVRYLRSPFLNVRIITLVCQSLGVLPYFHVTRHTRVNQRIPSQVSAFNISGLISSSPAGFSDFLPLIAVATFAAVKNSSFSKCITYCVSRVMPLQDSWDLQSIPFIVKGFHSHPSKCYLGILDGVRDVRSFAT